MQYLDDRTIKTLVALYEPIFFKQREIVGFTCSSLINPKNLLLITQHLYYYVLLTQSHHNRLASGPCKEKLHLQNEDS